MPMDEIARFHDAWDRESSGTTTLLESLPRDKYDFRPDAEGRSLGELAWHLAEIDGYMSHMVKTGSISPGERPPGLERPRTVAELAPGYARVHAEAKARLVGLQPADLERDVKFFDGRMMPARQILWGALLHH